jgi:hypothetical protein
MFGGCAVSSTPYDTTSISGILPNSFHSMRHHSSHSLATMSSLPQEVVDEISSMLGRDDLKNVLFVSRKFQRAAERSSGEFVSFTFRKLDPAECQAFHAKFSGHRFQYLRQIEVFTSFPPLDDSSATPCRLSAHDLQTRNEIFTKQIRDVWQAVQRVEQAQHHDSGPRLQIRVFTPFQAIDGDLCDHKRYSSWRVQLMRPHELPTLESVCALSTCNLDDDDLEEYAFRSKLDLRVIIDLAARCPNLQYLGCKLGADEWTDHADPFMEHFIYDYPGCRRDSRNDLANAIADVKLPPTLQFVQLDFINELRQSIAEQSKPMPDLVHPHSYDPLSTSLRHLSCQLRRMEIHTMADETLFWPRNDSPGPFWPHLEILSVLFHICSPSGSWYFQSPSGLGLNDDGYQLNDDNSYPPLETQEEDTEWCFESLDGTPNALATFRVAPIDVHMRPLLTAFARATTNMPKLLEAWLWTPLSYHPYDLSERNDEGISEQYPEGDLGWGVTYSAPGAPSLDGVALTTVRELKWRVGQWRPDPDVRAAFQSIGEDQYGLELDETWHEAGEEGRLVSRDWFVCGTICSAVASPNPYPTYI